jgi:hypothetical protein
VVSDAAVATAEHQHLDELVEQHPVGDAPAVAAERVGVGAAGQKGGELVPEGFEDAGWKRRHETSDGHRAWTP